MSDNKSVGLMVGNMRRKAGISQPELARICGMSKNYLSMIENGRRDIRIELLERLCSGCGRRLLVMEIDL